MAFVFSTEEVHPRERLSYWRDVMSVVPHEFASEAGPGFLGTVRSEMMGSVMLSDFRCDPCEVSRTSRNIAASDCDDYLLCCQMEGRAVVSQGDKQAVAETGGFVLIDPRRPFSVRYEGQTRSVSLQIPRPALESRLGVVAALSAHTMQAHSPLAELASGFLTMLPSRVDAIDDAVCAGLATQVLDLLALAFAAELDRSPALSSPRATTLLRLKSSIEARLCEPDLRPAAVAAAVGISVRYANDLLWEEGASIERYILHRRLERCRAALEDPTQAHRLVGEIAFSWGFSDLSHFSRRFRTFYGVTPGECRRLAQERRASSLHTKIE
jgi:AraC family transcriptional regulator, positive regulator of tynA and feaB